MQNRGIAAPIGVVYNTSMSRADAALALAELYAFENKREAKAGSVCVVGAGLKTAIFCDIIARFFLGPPQAGNQQLPIGLAIVDPMPPDPPMVLPIVNGSYTRSISRASDTSLAEAVIRNGVIFNPTAAIVLSAPATSLAKSLDLQGVIDLYRERVKRLIIVEAGVRLTDVSALRTVLTDFPSPIYFCGREVGDSLMFPGSSLLKEFSWAPMHPVVDAYRAARVATFDAPSHDLAAMYYAVHPEQGFFQESAPGTLTVADDGTMKFAPAANGKVRSLTADPAKRAAAVEAFVALASSQPPGRGRAR